MEKKQSIFKKLTPSAKNNPFLSLAILWVSLMPSLGSLLTIQQVTANHASLMILPIKGIGGLFMVLILTLVLGLALLPSTLTAVLIGFIWGWTALPLLVIGYTAASILGYGWGKALSGNSLQILLTHYPKAAKLIEEKKGHWGQLVFFTRLSPVIPFALSNLLFSLLSTGYKNLLIYGTLGMLPRTLIAFYSGTLANGIYQAIRQEEISGKGWLLLGFLALSFFGIWRFFKRTARP